MLGLLLLLSMYYLLYYLVMLFFVITDNEYILPLYYSNKEYNPLNNIKID